MFSGYDSFRAVGGSTAIKNSLLVPAILGSKLEFTSASTFLLQCPAYRHPVPEARVPVPARLCQPESAGGAGEGEPKFQDK